MSKNNYADIWLRNFWKMVQYNIFGLITNLPIAILLIFLIKLLFPTFFYFSTIKNYLWMEESLEIDQVHQIIVFYGAHITLFLTIALIGNLLIVNSPIQCSLAAIYRQHLQETPFFFFAELKKQIKENYRQTIPHFFLSMLILLILTIVFQFYRKLSLPYNFEKILSSLTMAMIIFWCLMQSYVYPMMACYELKLYYLYKNAAILVLLHLGQSILTFVKVNLILFLIPLLSLLFIPRFSLQISILYFLFFPFSYTQLLSLDKVLPYLKKYLG